MNYYATNKFPEAIEDFTKAIALAPDQSEGYRVRFEVYFQQDDFDKALNDINKAIELQPNALNLYFGRGELYLSKGDCGLLEKAIADYSLIITRNPNFPTVYYKRSATYKELADCSKQTADGYDQKSEKEKRKGEEVSGIFLNPRAKSLAQPVYPKVLIPLRITEKITVNVTVSGDGSLWGALYGDKGYLSKALTELLEQQNLQLITKVKKNMKEKLLPLFDKLMLRKRAVIESVFDQLKNISQIEHSRHRSVVNFLVNATAGLTAYTFREKKPSLNIQIKELALLAP